MPQKLTWDADGTRYYHTGVSQGVIYPMGSNNTYGAGVAWNGLTSVEESPDGADVTDLWADNMKYASFRSAENYKGTINAYMYPPEFDECNGYASPITGLKFGQQRRKVFGLCYRTEVGSDTNPEAGYILHIVYGCTVSPSSVTHDTINDNPDAAELSWDFESTPAAVQNVSGVKQVSSIEISSIDVGAEAMAAVEALLYGSNSADATLPTPDQLYAKIQNPTAGN